MSHTVTVATDVVGFVVLPDGQSYVADDVVTLTDAQYALASIQGAITDGVLTDGAFVSDASILVSPNGTHYQLVVANGGALSTTVVT